MEGQIRLKYNMKYIIDESQSNYRHERTAKIEPEYMYLPVANIGPECLHRLHMAHLKSLRLDQNF